MSISWCLAPLLATAAVLLSQPDDAKLRAELRAKDEVLLNAVHRGDQMTWAAVTTEDFLYIEDGQVLTRKLFLEQLKEDGYTPLIIRTFEVQRIGTTAMVLHLDDVPTRPLRDRRNSHLLFSETWQLTGRVWKLRRVDITRLRVDPPAITLSREQLDDITGTYRASGETCTIRREDNRILVYRTGQPTQEWKAESRDLFFAPGDARSRKIFWRSQDGRVTGFADRDESSEVDWERQLTPGATIAPER